jgi:hypothetical protein
MMAGRGPFCGDRSVFNLTQEFPMSTDAISPLRELMELWLILGDGMNQAADLASGATSIPSWNLTPWMTFGNWF